MLKFDVRTKGGHVGIFGLKAAGIFMDFYVIFSYLTRLYWIGFPGMYIEFLWISKGFF